MGSKVGQTVTPKWPQVVRLTGMNDENPGARLGQAIEERRVQLGLEYREISKAAKVSVESLRKLRQGAILRPANERRVEHALQWEAGSFDAIRAGDQPKPIPNAQFGALPPPLPTRPDNYPADFPDHEALWDLWRDERLAERDRYVAILAIKGQWDLEARAEGAGRPDRRAHLS